MKKVSMKIEGMSCSACANRIERIVNKLDGVEKGAVNFAAAQLLSATVLYLWSGAGMKRVWYDHGESNTHCACPRGVHVSKLRGRL